MSAAFYGGRLRTASGLAAARPCARACRLVDVSGSEEQHTGGGVSNREEALRAIEEAEAAASELEREGVNAGSLFIVTLYNRQRSLILDLLAQQGGGARLRRAYRQIAVLSADACQGSEADVVVISTVRNVSARGTTAAQLSQFFLDARRTNVALSRARHLSVVVGSAATLRQAAHRAPFWGHLLEHYRT